MKENLLHGKILLVVNTGSIKKKFIFQKLKRLGIKIVVLNKEKNWAQPYVDHWILADNYNHEEVIEKIKSFLVENPEIKIAGAVTYWEDDVPLLSKICKTFKLIGNGGEAASNTRDKFRMQEVLRKCGLPYIKQKLLRSEKDLKKAIKEIGFPAVIKPVFGAESQFVTKVDDPEEAKQAYQYVLKNCTPEFDPIFKYNESLFIYQEYIEGQEFSVECYVQHGIPHVVGIHEKTVMDLPFFLETGDYIPPRINNEKIQKLEKFAESALIVLGVRNSLAHVEVKMNGHEPRVIEVASRLGGDYTYENILDIYSFDLIKASCEIALGINIEEVPREPKKYILSRYFIPKNSGVITKVRDLEALQKNRKVSGYLLNKKVGDEVFVPPDGYENIGWVCVKGESYAEVDRVIDNIFEKVSIELAPFKSYSSFGKTFRKNRYSSALITNKDSIIKAKKIENIRKFSERDLKKLHIGIACNIYSCNDPILNDLMSVGRNIEKTLQDRGYQVTFFDFNDLPKAFSDIRRSDVDIIFNVCERINDSSLLEPHSAAILDALQVPYTGSNPMTLALCIDKIRVKKLLAFHDIPTPKWDYAYSMEDYIDEDLRYPLIVKPGNTDNSIGITNESVVTNKKELKKQMEYVIKEMKRPVLVEEYIEGDEYDVTIIGNDEDELQVLPLSRSIFKNMPPGFWHIYPYQVKWSSEDSVYDNIVVQRPPRNISQKLASLITEIALDTYRILDCHDYGRVEIRVDADNNPYVLELNPNPSINIEDLIPHVAEIAGMNYGEFLENIILMAIQRYKNNPPYYHLQSTMI